MALKIGEEPLPSHDPRVGRPSTQDSQNLVTAPAGARANRDFEWTALPVRRTLVMVQMDPEKAGTLKRLARILPFVAVVSAVLATAALVFSHRAAFAYSQVRLMIEIPSFAVGRPPTREELIEARESARSLARVWHASEAFFGVTLGLSLWSVRAEVRRWPWFS